MAEENVATTGTQVGLDKAAMQKSVDAFAVKLEADVVAKAEAETKRAALLDENKNLKMDTEVKPLSEEYANRTLRFEKLKVDLKTIQKNESDFVPEQVKQEAFKRMDETRAKYEPVIYIPGNKPGDPEFLPAIATVDSETETEYLYLHAMIPDIGENAVLEEVVADRNDPTKILETRYWVRSDDAKALEKAAKVKWGREKVLKPGRMVIDSGSMPGKPDDWDKATSGSEYQYRDKSNRLLAEPIVLVQLSPADVTRRLNKDKNVFILRNSDLVKDPRGLETTTEIREKKLLPPSKPVSETYTRSSPEVSVEQRIDMAGDPKRENDERTAEVLEYVQKLDVQKTEAKEEEAENSLRVKVGDQLYSVSKPLSSDGGVVMYEGVGGVPRISRERLIEIRDSRRVGVVDLLPGGKVFEWSIPAGNQDQVLEDHPVPKDEQKINFNAEPPEDAELSNHMGEYRELTGGILANIAELADDRVLSFEVTANTADYVSTSRSGNEAKSIEQTDYGFTKDERLGNAAVQAVFKTLRENASATTHIIDEAESEEENLIVTNIVTPDKRVLVLYGNANRGQILTVDFEKAKAWHKATEPIARGDIEGQIPHKQSVPKLDLISEVKGLNSLSATD